MVGKCYFIIVKPGLIQVKGGELYGKNNIVGSNSAIGCTDMKSRAILLPYKILYFCQLTL
jgi:hypothetical protein